MRRRSSLSAIPACAALLILAACGGGSASTDATPGGDSSEPPEPPAESEAAAESMPAESESEPAATDAGSGTSGEAPALADGPWTGGQGAVTVAGAVEWATDEPITTEVSETTDAKTLLAYNSDDTYVTIYINLTGVPFHASVTAPAFDASSDDCEATYARADDTGIEGSFSCVVDEFHWFSADPEPTGEVTIEGTFTATR